MIQELGMTGGGWMVLLGNVHDQRFIKIVFRENISREKIVEPNLKAAAGPLLV